MKSLREHLQEAGIIGKGRKIEEWQDTAARMAKGLEISFPNQGVRKRWFKIFKDAYAGGKQGYLEAAFSATVDSRSDHKMMTFLDYFWRKQRRSEQKE